MLFAALIERVYAWRRERTTLTALKRLMGKYATREKEVDDLLRTGAFVDLYRVVHQGFVIGTPSYMSPEQVKGRPIDGRSDIFSVGCTLYELLTGERAFNGNSATTKNGTIATGTSAAIASRRLIRIGLAR